MLNYTLSISRWVVFYNDKLKYNKKLGALAVKDLTMPS